MMLTHITPAVAIRLLFLTCMIVFATATTKADRKATTTTTMTTRSITASVGSTRNIVSKKEGTIIDGSSSSSSSSTSSHHRRSLIELDEMVCQPDISDDGSIICTFRTMPPTDMTSTNTHHDCLYHSKMGGNICIATEVSRATFDQANGGLTSGSGPTPGSTPGSTPGLGSTDNNKGNDNHSIYEQKCPAIVPRSRSQCGGWIPTGANEANCMYGSTPCKCVRNDNASLMVWNCVGDAGDPSPIVIIDADLSSVVIPPQEEEEAAVIPSRTGTINVPTPDNGASCPSSLPDTGDTCIELTRCGYHDDISSPTKIIDCRCDANQQFSCADAVSDIYQVSF